MRTGKPITIRAYLNIKGISYKNDIYMALKGLKMAREEGVEVYAEAYDKMPYLANVTMGKRIDGQIVLNSLDEELDFDLLARQVTGRNDITWDMYVQEEDKKIKDRHVQYEQERADENAAYIEKRKETVSRLGQYAYGEELYDCTKADRGSVGIMVTAADVLEACEKGKTPSEAMAELKVYNPDIVMAFILDKAKNGPAMYEQYMQATGRNTEDLSQEAKAKLEGIKSRNEAYESVRNRPMTVREYLNLKGIIYTNYIPDAYRALKMAREEGVEVYDKISDEMSCVKKLPFGKRADREVELNSLDPKLDFDVLAQHLEGKKGLTWDAYEAERAEEERIRKEREESTRKEREAKFRAKKETALEKIRAFSYGEAMDPYSNPDELAVDVIDEAADILAACERGENPGAAAKRMNIERPLYAMTLILNVAKNGPEIYEKYIREGGLEIENLGPEMREKFKSIKARNARYEEEARTQSQFIYTISNLATDEEFVEVAEETVEPENAEPVKSTDDVGLPGGDDGEI